MSLRRRSIEWAEAVLLLIAAGCLGWWVYVNADSFVYQSYSEYQLEQSARGESITWAGYLKHIFSGEHGRESSDVYEDLARKSEQTDKEQNRPYPLGPDGLVGKIEIKRLNVSAIVREGVDNGTLRKAVGHVPGTAFPGEQGNAALAAHRDTFFRGLREVKTDDVIRLTGPTGTHDYKVASLQIVNPKDVHVLDETGDSVLTLVTCYPFNYIGHAPKRFVVRANLMVDSLDSAAPSPANAASKTASADRAPKAEPAASKAKKRNSKKPSALAKARHPKPVIVVSNEDKPELETDATADDEPEMPRKTLLGKLKSVFRLNR